MDAFLKLVFNIFGCLCWIITLRITNYESIYAPAFLSIGLLIIFLRSNALWNKNNQRRL